MITSVDVAVTSQTSSFTLETGHQVHHIFFKGGRFAPILTPYTIIDNWQIDNNTNTRKKTRTGTAQYVIRGTVKKIKQSHAFPNQIGTCISCFRETPTSRDHPLAEIPKFINKNKLSSTYRTHI